VHANQKVKMCPKTSKTTPLLLIGGICFVIVLVGITGITLINNINLSNIIRLNEKVASDSVSNNENQIKELNYVNNHPRNVYLKLNASSRDDEDDEQMQKEQEQLELPKISAVIGGSKPKVEDNQVKESSEVISPSSSTFSMRSSAGELTSTSAPLSSIVSVTAPPMPFGGVKYNQSSGLIDYEKRNQVVKVSQGLKPVYLVCPIVGLNGVNLNLKYPFQCGVLLG